MQVDGASKRKFQKVWSIDLGISDRSKSDGSDTWRDNAIKNEIFILNPMDKYTHWLIPKFTLIAKKARLIPERRAKMIIRDSMISQENDVLTEMLYNQEAVLV